MLEDIIDGLPKALEISPIKTHASHIRYREIKIKEKFAKLAEKLEVVHIQFFC